MVEEYGTFLPSLKMAVEKLQPTSILELGMGESSTPYLHELAKSGIKIMSYDNNPDWFKRYMHCFKIENHSGICHPSIPYPVYEHSYDIALIDHAPGENRRLDIMRLIDRVKVFVIHDTQPEADKYGYFFSLVWPHFSYIAHSTENGIRTTVASNTVDVTKWQLPRK